MNTEKQQLGTITRYPYRTVRPYNTLIRAHRSDMQNIEQMLAHQLNVQIDNHTGYLISWWDENRKVHNNIGYYFSDSEVFICQHLDRTNEQTISANDIKVQPIYHPIYASDLDPLSKPTHYLDLSNDQTTNN